MREGEKNGRSRLTKWRVEVLRRYYERNKRPNHAPKHDSWVTANEIAHRLHLAVSTVQSMLQGETWK